MLSFPSPSPRACATCSRRTWNSAALCGRICLRAVFGYYRSDAPCIGVEEGCTGAVNQIQRFGSALNLNPHFHALVLDGVYSAPDVWMRPRFHRAHPVTSVDVAKIVFAIRSRVLRLCRRRGLLGEEGELEARSDDVEQGLLPLLSAASIQGRSILGEEPGARVARLGVSPERVRGRAVVVKELCAELDGFSLHAAVRVEAQERSRLEHLCRYIARPPFSNNRLSFSRSGKIVLALRAPFRDGSPSKRPTGAFRSAFGGPGLTPRTSCSSRSRSSSAWRPWSRRRGCTS